MTSEPRTSCAEGVAARRGASPGDRAAEHGVPSLGRHLGERVGAPHLAELRLDGQQLAGGEVHHDGRDLHDPAGVAEQDSLARGPSQQRQPDDPGLVDDVAVGSRGGRADRLLSLPQQATVLKHVVDMASVGDDGPAALLDRPWMDQMRSAPDGSGAVEVWLDVSRDIYARVSPVMRVVREAAGSDPEMAEQQRLSRSQSLTAHRVLAERGCLRAGMDVDEAGEVLYGLVSLDLYVLFVDELGWSPARWQEWATDAVVMTVLHPGG